jgi:hypothetical protein
MALRCDLDRVSARFLQTANNSFEISRRPLKIVVRHHHLRGRKRAREFTSRKVLCRLNLDVAPAATRSHRLRQNLDLGVPAASKQPSTLFPPARGDEDGAGPLALQPGKKGRYFARIAQIVEPQFQRASLAQAQAHLRTHFPRRPGSDDTTHSVISKETLQAPSTPEAEL